MAVERDTRDVHLCDADRFNYYPATPFPSITWILDGHLQMVKSDGDETSPKLGAPLAGVFYPEALVKLFGLTIRQYIGSVLPLKEVLAQGERDQLSTMTYDDGFKPFEQIQQLLRSLWNNVPVQQTQDVRSWLKQLVAETSSKTGMIGQRTMQRLVKNWTGQSLRDLQLYARVENAMSYGAEILDDEGLNLAAIAAQTGFSDQSHLGREVRRVTGLSPARLNELIKHDEAFWMYRLLA
ncbi:helix-turn-helix domain-containing protein [Pseudochrobactrum asaccharolyticum]|uniref:helix-turn-helix domain-containing protein n=1 Tax=Pseudochrobactrum asaccharolyticum TaxID=354351 RepID=UPI00404237FF